jgi:hypothetical protein
MSETKKEVTTEVKQTEKTGEQKTEAVPPRQTTTEVKETTSEKSEK